MKNTYRKMIEDHEALTVGLLLAFGCLLRVYAVGSLPYGLNQDEASSLYEAWSLLHYGIDRNGSAHPVLFISWGSGQNVLLSYLAIPFVALLGPTAPAIRLPNAILGCVSLLIFWLYGRRAGGKYLGVCALAFLALNPWHIMESRWALESNLFPQLMLAGIYFTALARERPWALTAASAVFALSLYAYGTAFFFLPFYLVFSLIFLRRELKAAPFALSLGIFVLIALPAALCQAVNLLGLEPMSFLGMTLPKLTQTRQTATSVFGGGHVAENIRDAAALLITQSDGLVFNALPLGKGGIFYFFGLPTAVAGFAVSLGKRRDRTWEGPMRIALYSSIICTGLIRCNINRINMIWLPLVYFSAVGAYELMRRLKSRWLIPAAGILACFFVFLSSYCKTFGGEGSSCYFPGLGEAIEYARSVSAEDEDIYITDYVNQPYIFALVYSRTSPHVFSESVEYADSGAAFRRVKRFEGFEFEKQDSCTIAVLGRWETEGSRVLETFGKYSVCIVNEE